MGVPGAPNLGGVDVEQGASGGGGGGAAGGAPLQGGASVAGSDGMSRFEVRTARQHPPPAAPALEGRF